MAFVGLDDKYGICCMGSLQNHLDSKFRGISFGTQLVGGRTGFVERLYVGCEMGGGTEEPLDKRGLGGGGGGGRFPKVGGGVRDCALSFSA